MRGNLFKLNVHVFSVRKISHREEKYVITHHYLSEDKPINVRRNLYNPIIRKKLNFVWREINLQKSSLLNVWDKPLYLAQPTKRKEA